MKTDLLFPPAPFELLLVALGVLLLCPLEFDVESGMSSEGSSQPWHDFFVLESGENTAFITRDSIIMVIIRIYRELRHSNNVKLTTRLAVVVALQTVLIILFIGFRQSLPFVLHSSILKPYFYLCYGCACKMRGKDLMPHSMK